MKCRLGGYKGIATVVVLGVVVLGGNWSRCNAAPNLANARNQHKPLSKRNESSKRQATVTRLNEEIGVLWSGTPLRDALNDIVQHYEVPIWLDRRTDPGQPVSLRMQDKPIKNVLLEVAHRQKLGVCLFRGVCCLGPPEEVAKFRTLGALRRKEAGKLLRSPRTRFLKDKKVMQWEDLAEPRGLLSDLGAENDLEIANLDLVPHDLWPATKLPEMALADQLTLLLAPFGLTYRIEEKGARIRLVPIPDRVSLARHYPGGADPEQLVQRWKKLAPESRIHVEGRRIVVEGRLEDHERLRGSKRISARPDKKHTHPSSSDSIADIRIHGMAFRDKPLAPVIRSLAKQLKLELTMDVEELRRAGIDPQQRISFEEVDTMTVDEMFQKLLKPVGLTFRRQGKKLEIRPKHR